eukprot:TRINITY_DN24775_c0_g1_i1.p1 TRINITY_DN24775_c0_g1~~TRINITY_DN24775_c0_g1_i1.p1  ORF type:complete len:135 (+),score=63.66 TRINITY_DN24775_c0_g1_i1:107-511(+)
MGERDAALIDALCKYDVAMAQQGELNSAVHEALLNLVRARAMLDMAEGNELCSEVYPEAAEARMKVVVNGATGAMAAREDAKVPNPQAHFARSRDLLAEAQGSFQTVVRAAVKLAAQRRDLVEAAEAYAALPGE